MRKAGLIVYSALLWTFFLGSSIVLFSIAFLLWLVTRWFDRRLVLLHIWSCFWGSWYIWFNPLWRVRISGRRKIPWRRPCILVSNHQSMLDILVLYQLFVPYKWVSKKENFSIPIIGWLMRLNEYLEIERGQKGSLVKLMDKSRRFIEQGNSIMIFPEGTRYPGDTLGPFKEGAFRMALDNRVDIIPILLEGTARALPKKGAILTGFSDIRVRVLDPIPYSTFAGKQARELLNEVRDRMSDAYEKMRSPDKPGTRGHPGTGNLLEIPRAMNLPAGIENRILRRMKYTSDQQGILNRYLAEGENWDKHLERTRSFIVNCIKESRPESVAILGSGWLLDVPLDYLCDQQRQVYLVDVVHPAQIIQKTKTMQNIRLVRADLTGGAILGAYQLVKNRRKTGHGSILDIACQATLAGVSADYLVSLNILNQLDILLVDFIKRNMDVSAVEVDAFRKRIQQQHLDLLRPGHACLISDVEERVLNRKGQIVSTKRLAYAELPPGVHQEEWTWTFDTRGEYHRGHHTEMLVKAIQL